MKNVISLFLWLALSFSAGWFGSQFKPGAWYESIQKPRWTPPSLVFPIAWSILYTLMGVAAWMVWKRREEDPFVIAALSIFILQLVLNALWSWIFFGQHQIGWALFEIIALWIAVILTTISFYRVYSAAGYLLVPYIFWVGFAILLNGFIWKRN